MTRVVVALGGNALLRRGEAADARTQEEHVRDAARALAEAAGELELVLTHGNGPQVGLLALQAAAYGEVAPYPLDVLGAESEGMIGYLLELALRNELPGREIATLLTQVLVDPQDEAFAHPTKPIGPFYGRAEAAQVAAARGWTLAELDGGSRRVVPSPEPLEVVELQTIRLLVGAGVLVICGGGGGIPVVRRDGAVAGVEAVVDKDLFAALLARSLDADALVLLTDVAAVERDWGTATATPIGRTTAAELRALQLEPGSMAPKVEAACRFVEATGGRASIGALAEAARVARGEAGTIVVA
jgi:carbamate kinase